MQELVKPNTKEVASKIVDGEAILINLSNGIYYSLDPVGSYIWSLIESKQSLGNISRAVSQRFGVAEETAGQDVQALARQLLDQGIVIPDDGPAAAALETVAAAGAEPYAAPELTQFDDMADLFALDPPLPELSKVSEGRG